MPFLTGDDTSDTVDISLTLPDDEHLLAAVLGQLTSLTYPSNWEQDGTATPAQRADEMRAAIGNLDHAPGGDMLTPIDRAPDYVFFSELLVNTEAGTFTSGAWRDRVLNVIAVNRDDAASLNFGDVTVPTANYWVYAFAEAYRVGIHVIRLWNVDDAAEETPSYKKSSDTRTGSDGTQTTAELWMQLDADGAKELRLQHRCETTKSSNGLGRKNAWEQPIVAGMMFWRTD